jgi:hypothetical protein
MSRTDDMREHVIDAMSWAETFDGGRMGRDMAASILDRYVAAVIDERQGRPAPPHGSAMPAPELSPEEAAVVLASMYDGARDHRWAEADQIAELVAGYPFATEHVSPARFRAWLSDRLAPVRNPDAGHPHGQGGRVTVSEPTQQNRERAAAVVNGLGPEHAYVDEFVFDGEADALREAVARAIADAYRRGYDDGKANR